MDSMYDVLLQLPLFQGVSRVKMSEIIEKTRFHFLKYQDNEIIARRGEECTHMKFIVSGSARAELKNINGKIRVTETLHAPNILYPNHLFGRNTTYPSEVTAKENCGIMQIDKQAFVTLIQQSPIFIITYYKDRRMSAEIWGMSLGEGVSIELESTVIRTIDPPSEIRYEYNPELPYGTEKTTVKARTGYVVETEKVWLKDGQETSRELMHTSNYRAYQQVIEYNY